jgi:hypothetical protein
MYDFFRCDEGYDERASRVAHKACYKLMKDMHYEARVQAVIQYHAIFEKRKVDKEAARNMTLTKEQYLPVNTDFPEIKYAYCDLVI